MDRNSILALILISLLIIGYMFYSSVTYQPPPETKNKKQDTGEVETQESSLFGDGSGEEKQVKSESKELEYGQFQPFTKGDRKVITVETDLYKAKISSKGGDLIKWYLKEYDKWDGEQVQLVKDYEGVLHLDFTSSEGVKIDTRNLYFNIDSEQEHVNLSEGEEFVLTATLEVEPGKKIVKKYKFYGDKYIVDTGVELQEMGDYIPRGYLYSWTGGLAYQEKNSVDESSEAMAIAQMNGEIVEYDYDSDEKSISRTGKVDYLGTKLKYFGMAIIPQDFDGTIDMAGERITYPATEGEVQEYDVSFRVPYQGGTDSREYKVFIGPLKLDIVEEYGLNRMVNLGWWGIRHIGEYLMMPIFRAVHYFIPNWGITIIVFSILIKLVLYPLSVTQLKNAQKMKLLSPEITKMREKFKDEPKKQQKEMMNIYSKYGVNPASGCLPMLLQMPILYSLWVLFRTNIDLRQSEFIYWITDLSTPDSIVSFGTSILGISSISGLALMMGISMFVQQKMTISDPRQKGLVYIMPVMFTLLFSSFPAGLNLYYFMFNLLGIGQQVYLNNFSKTRATSLDDLAKSPKKKSWIQKKMEEAQAVAEEQGKTPPGMGGGKGQNPKNPNYRKKKNRKKK